MIHTFLLSVSCLRPVTISVIIAPKLKMSALKDTSPLLAYSGAEYPLHRIVSSMHYIKQRGYSK